MMVDNINNISDKDVKLEQLAKWKKRLKDNLHSSLAFRKQLRTLCYKNSEHNKYFERRHINMCAYYKIGLIFDERQQRNN